MTTIKMISVRSNDNSIYGREAADYINNIANANGWTAENRRNFEEQIAECDEWIASKLYLEEWDCELEE